MPTGTTGQIQTSVAQQVNLVVAGGQNPDPEPGAVPDIQFWNGTTTVANGMVNGGSGIWNGTDTNWTDADRSEEHTSELQSLMRITYAVIGLKKKTNTKI